MISVVIPLYNKEKYIERCLNSILNQLSVDDELIIIDDLSVDNGVRVVERYKNDANIKILKNMKNKGPSYSRNRGVKEAKNNYIIFLDADDYVSPDLIEELKGVISKHPDIQVFGYSFSKKYKKDLSAGWGIFPTFSFQKYAVHKKILLTASSACCHKSVFERVGGFNEDVRVFEDPDLWCRISEYFPVLYTSQQLSHYDQSVGLSLSKRWYLEGGIPIVLYTLKDQIIRNAEYVFLKKMYGSLLVKTFLINKALGKRSIYIDQRNLLRYSMVYDRILCMAIDLLPSAVIRLGLNVLRSDTFSYPLFLNRTQ